MTKLDQNPTPLVGTEIISRQRLRRAMYMAAFLQITNDYPRESRKARKGGARLTVKHAWAKRAENRG